MVTHWKQDKMVAPLNYIFKFIFLHENSFIVIQLLLKFVPMDLITNKPELTQIMAERQKSDKLWVNSYASITLIRQDFIIGSWQII